MLELRKNAIYGNYICTHSLNATPQGAVYLAYHKDVPDQPLALRTLQLPSEKMTALVLDECNDHMALVKSVTAPHTIPVLDYGVRDYEYYLVMPYIDGMSLSTLIKKADRDPDAMPSFGEILTFTETIIDALDEIHKAGMTHGAIEPRNIFIDYDSQTHLADIGLARLMKIAFSLQNTGSFWTGKYTAPEVWNGERNTPLSDQYSLACVIYRLMTGRAPFRAKTFYEMMELHQNAIITPPSYIRKNAPASLLMFFLTATAKRPTERFRSLQEFLRELTLAIRSVGDEPIGFFDIREQAES